jgi:hypothetical protein
MQFSDKEGIIAVNKEPKEDMLTMERKILALVALVGSLVACFPTACCLGFYGLGGFTGLMVDPRMIEAAAGAEGPPGREFFVLLGVGSTLGALVALGVGIACLVWGIRTLLRARA